MVSGIIQALKNHKINEGKKLRQRLFSSMAMYGIGVFISYHYNNDHVIAKEITQIVNKDKLNIYTVVKENKNKKKQLKLDSAKTSFVAGIIVFITILIGEK